MWPKNALPRIDRIGSGQVESNAGGQVAQSVERSPEKAGVGGSIPSLATMFLKDLLAFPYIRRPPVESIWSPNSKKSPKSVLLGRMGTIVFLLLLIQSACDKSTCHDEHHGHRFLIVCIAKQRT